MATTVRNKDDDDATPTGTTIGASWSGTEELISASSTKKTFKNTITVKEEEIVMKEEKDSIPPVIKFENHKTVADYIDLSINISSSNTSRSSSIDSSNSSNNIDHHSNNKDQQQEGNTIDNDNNTALGGVKSRTKRNSSGKIIIDYTNNKNTRTLWENIQQRTAMFLFVHYVHVFYLGILGMIYLYYCWDFPYPLYIFLIFYIPTWLSPASQTGGMIDGMKLSSDLNFGPFVKSKFN